MVKYDAQVIATFAEKLYRQASFIVAVYTIMGILIGLAVGVVVGNALGNGNNGLIGAVTFALVFGFVALKAGQQRAFALKLQAQLALCQVQIEANTRGHSSAP